MRPRHWVYTIPLRLRSLFLRRHVEQELDEELRYHVEHLIREYVSRGMKPREARNLALRAMGGVEQQKEQCRNMRHVNFVEHLQQDISFGFRMLRKHPGFALAAIIAMALGIGANSAVFSVLNSVILNPLPFKEPDRIVKIGEVNAAAQSTFPVFAPANYIDFAAQQKSFETVATIQNGGITYSSNGENEDWNLLRVTEGFFPTLGVTPLSGRIFTVGDMPSNAPATAILSFHLWQNKFGGDTNIVGRTLILNKQPTTVIGIMAASFRSPTGFEFADLWMPLATDGPGWNERNDRYMRVFGRLKPGISQTQAQNEMNILADRFAQAYPASNKGYSIQVIDLAEDVVGNIRSTLLILFAAGCCVLLVACANVANLLLARASARKRELGIRAALGASRGRLVRQVLTESIILTLTGGALGSILTWWSVRIIRDLKPGGLPRVEDLGVDWRVLLFTLTASILAGCACGAISGWLSTRSELADALNDGGSRTSGGIRHARARSVLIVAEISLSLMLLVSAGLLTRSFYQMTHESPGFDSQNVFTAGIRGQGNTQSRSQFYKQVTARLKSIPGIESAALVTTAPLLSPGTVGFLFSVKGQSVGGANNDKVRMTVDSVTPDFFKALKIPVKSGREITEQDKLGNHLVCVVNETLARSYFGSNQAALGNAAEIVYLGETITPEIVGVVGDTKRGSLAEVMQPSVYLSESQVPWFNAMIVARTKSNPVDYTKAIQQAIRETGSDQNLYRPQAMDTAITQSVAQPRFYSQLFGAFAAIAVIMASVGLYGVISYMTSQRTQEIGIRVALGAQKRDVLKLILSQGMGLVAVGIIVGIGGALGATRFLEAMLYGVSTKDFFSYLSVSVLLAIVALFACYIPARRATKVDPMTALRYE